MKRSLASLFLLLSPCIAQTTASDKAALEQASALFPAFSKAVYTDEEKAREVYNQLLALPPVVHERLLAWLDKQFEAKTQEIQKAKTGDTFGIRSPSPSDERKMKELRGHLMEIRSMNDENEMKKVLQQTGWPALRQLLSLNQSTVKSLATTTTAGPNPAQVESATKQAKQVGQFRYELRKKMGKVLFEVDDEIRKIVSEAGSSDKAASIRTSRKAASVLKKNEDMKGKIPAKEYTGILELNHWRIAAGLDPLLIDPKLCDAARDHSKDMEKLGFFAHDSPVKGKTKPWDRAKNFGTTARGENIAMNDSTAASNQAWFLSPGHYKNLMNPEFSVMGLGVHGRHYTQLFR